MGASGGVEIEGQSQLSAYLFHILVCARVRACVRACMRARMCVGGAGKTGLASMVEIWSQIKPFVYILALHLLGVRCRGGISEPLSLYL